MSDPAFRFAPSPNGYLHLGHAYSALLNRRMADEQGGSMLLRIDDIDLTRARPEYERAIIEDLTWLGVAIDGEIRRQSDHLSDYRSALETLRDEGLAYPAFMSRADIRDAVAEAEAGGQAWPRDPDGAPHYPGDDRHLSEDEVRRRIDDGAPHSWRLDMAAALSRVGSSLCWSESGSGPGGETGIVAADAGCWGDVVLARRDTEASYHLSVVIDDAVQNISHVVRGLDLFFATAVHRLLQELLGLPVPHYHHHRLVLDADGRKLSKSRSDTAIREMRNAGLSPAQVIRSTGVSTD